MKVFMTVNYSFIWWAISNFNWFYYSNKFSIIKLRGIEVEKC
jgi:hypothetical protein